MEKKELAAHLAKLHHQLHEAEKHRRAMLKKIDDIKQACINREITYKEYEQKINTEVDGKNVSEWVKYYDAYIDSCEKEIEKHAGLAKSQIYSQYGLVAVLVLIGTIFMITTSITGHSVDGNLNNPLHAIEIEKTLDAPGKFDVGIAENGKIAKVMFTGKVYGKGQATIFLNDIPITEISSHTENGVVFNVTCNKKCSLSDYNLHAKQYEIRVELNAEKIHIEGLTYQVGERKINEAT